MFLVLSTGHALWQVKLGESSQIWTQTFKQVTFSVGFTLRIFQSDFPDPWWIMTYRISNDCVSWARAPIMRHVDKLLQRETYNNEITNENLPQPDRLRKWSLNTHSIYIRILATVLVLRHNGSMGLELKNFVRLSCTFGSNHFCRGVLEEELTTGRTLCHQVFLQTVLNLLENLIVDFKDLKGLVRKVGTDFVRAYCDRTRGDNLRPRQSQISSNRVGLN